MDFLRDVLWILRLYWAFPSWCWRCVRRHLRVAWFRERLAERRRERRLPGRCHSVRHFKRLIAESRTEAERNVNLLWLRMLKEGLGEVRRRS